MNRRRKTSKNVTLGLLLTAGSSLMGQLYHQSFDYTLGDDGNTMTETNFPGEGWSSGTGVITYEHNAGLSFAGAPGSGGALVYDYTGGTGNRGTTQTASFLDYADFDDGQVFEFSALMQVDRADFSSAVISFNGGTVNNLTFGVDSSNQLFAKAWTNGAETTVTGPTLTLGATNSFLLRLTKGTGASPIDSLVEIWFNADLSNPGLADFTSTSDTRLGRDGASNAYTEVSFAGAAIGDARVIWDEVKVVAVPEPQTYALALGILALGIVCWRRRQM